MTKYTGKLILTCFVLTVLGAGEVKAETGTTGIILAPSSSSSQSDTSKSSASSTINSNASSQANTSTAPQSDASQNNSSPTPQKTTVKPAAALTAAVATPASNSSGAVPGNVQASSVQVDPNSGSASLSVPIVVPPGRAGIQPNLALIYNSSNRQLGNAGVGWDLDLGSIQRSLKNGVPSYNDAQDIFTIEKDGATQDMVADPNVPGLYHMEVEGAFAKIQYQGGYWLITDKKGTKYYYGSTNDSKIYDGPSNVTFRWGLNRVEDVNGNYMTITYLNPYGPGIEILPQTIAYTGNDQASPNLNPYAQVSINYDVSNYYSSFNSGWINYTGALIKSITTSVGSNIQSTYTFNYNLSNDTNRSLLQSIQQTGSDATSTLPAVTFTYSTSSGQYGQNIQRFTSSQSNPPILGDFNGDGIMDIANYNPSTGIVGVSLASSEISPTLLQYNTPSTWLTGAPLNQMAFAADMNGDGKTDLVFYNPSTSNWTVAYSNGNSFNPPVPLLNNFGNGQQVGIADFNGDGLPDLYTYKTINGWVYANIMIQQKSGGFVNINNNAPNIFIGRPGDKIFTGDFNGDGLADFCTFTPSTGEWFIMSNGGNSGVPNNWGFGNLAYFNGFGTNQNPILGDFKGDGKTDIGYVDSSTGKIYFMSADGNANDTTITTSSFTLNNKSSSYNFEAADLNGDGVTDVFDFNAAGNWEEVLDIAHLNTPNDLLTNINNGVGALTTITYDSNSSHSFTIPYYFPVVSSIATTVGSDTYTTGYMFANGLWDPNYREFDGFYFTYITYPQGDKKQTFYIQDHWLKGRPSEEDTFDSNNNLYKRISNQWQTQNIATNGATNQISKFVYLARQDNFLYDGSSSVTPKQTAQEFIYAENPQYGDSTQIINDGQIDPTTGVNSVDPNRTITQISYVHNTNNWLIGFPSQSITQNTNGNTVSKTSFYYDGDTTGNAAPSMGRLTAKVNWLGSATQPDPKTSYTYDAYGNLRTTTDPNGNTTTIVYDNTVRMFPEQTINALKQLDTMTYYGIDASPLDNGQGLHGLWGQGRSKTDANNQTAYTTYDTFGRPLASISPLDSVALPTEQKAYNIQSDYIEVTDTARVTNGSSTSITTTSFYDGLGRLIETKSLGPTPGQYIVAGQTGYGQNVYGYDTGLPTTKYLPHFTSNDLNTLDPINTTVPSTQLTYDLMGRVITKTNPDGTYSSIRYIQWTTITTDENGHMQESYVDAFGRLVQKLEYTGADGRSPNYPLSPYNVYATTAYTYDPKGNLISVIDNKNNVTNMTYDNLNRKTGMNDPDMGKWQYGYDNNGNLIWQQNAKGQVISFKYDALNRLINKTDAVNGPIINLPNLPKTPATFNVNYNFDNPQGFGIGRLSSISYDNGAVAFMYDQLGREISCTKNIDGKNYSVTRQYDDLDRLKQLQYPDAAQVGYVYNQAGQVTAVADAGAVINGVVNLALNDVTEHEHLGWVDKALGINNAYGGTTGGTSNVYIKFVNYNANGQITQIQYGNGTATAYTYDPQSFRLTRIYTLNAQAKKVQDLVYTYDSLGQITAIRDNVNSATQNFAYDELNRLVKAQNAVYGGKTYAYDTIGNIIQKDGLTYRYGEAGSRTDGSAAGPHAVTSLSDGTSFKYDANGNLVSLKKGNNLTQYAYDSQNRLQDVTVGGLKAAVYGYDGDGGRVVKLVYRRDLALYNDNTNPLLFGSANGSLPATAQNPTVDTTIEVGNLYKEEGSQHTKFIYLGNTRVAEIGSDGDVFYYHTDYLGSTNVLTDSSGSVRELTEYDPYGQVIVHDKYGSDFATAWYYFTGKPLDDETGLIFLGARYYNPVLGRFITPDTIVQAPSNPQTLNRYTYCNNNPVNLVDPTGHGWFSKIFSTIGNIISSVSKAIVNNIIPVALSVATIAIGVVTYNPYLIAAGSLSLFNTATSGYQGGAWSSLHQVIGYAAIAVSVAGGINGLMNQPESEISNSLDNDANYVPPAESVAQDPDLVNPDSQDGLYNIVNQSGPPIPTGDVTVAEAIRGPLTVVTPNESSGILGFVDGIGKEVTDVAPELKQASLYLFNRADALGPILGTPLRFTGVMIGSLSVVGGTPQDIKESAEQIEFIYQLGKQAFSVYKSPGLAPEEIPDWMRGNE